MMEDMDFMNTEEDDKHVYKLNVKVFNKLNLCTSSTGNVILWNKYQILLYEKAVFDRDPIEFLPEFCLSLVILYENHIINLDCDGNVHVTPLKFKSNQNKPKIMYKPIARGIVAMSKLNTDNVLLMNTCDNQFSLYIFKIPKFDSHKLIVCNLPQNTQNITSGRKVMVKCYPISDVSDETLSCIFKGNRINSKDCYFMLISFDEQNICACMFDLNLDRSADIVNLYSCPSNISGMDLVYPGTNDIIISLRSGSLIKLTLSSSIVSKVIHLNTPVHKMLVDKTSVYYSDCLSMWKIDAKSLETDLNFKQITVKQVKDFVKVSNKIVCTTFSNLVYTFPFEQEDLYVANNADEKYIPIHKVISYTEDLIDKITFETKRNDEMASKNHLEVNYTAAIALANRPDIMDNIITHTVVIYDNYEDVISENKSIYLTNELSDYFDKNCRLVLIKLQLSAEYKHNLKDILAILMENLKLHINISGNNAVLKTTSVSLNNILDRGDFLIPIESEYLEVTVGIKLVCPIPGPMDKNQLIWTVLSEKSINLTSEHFIKAHNAEHNVTNLKELKESFSKTIIKAAEHYHGLLFNFKNVECKAVFKEHSHHIVLPENYEKYFINKELYNLSKKTSEFLSRKLSNNDFLKFSHKVQLSINNNKLQLQIVKKNNDALLRISGENGLIVCHMRNYFAKLLNDGSKLVSHAQYTNLEVSYIFALQVPQLIYCLVDHLPIYAKK